MLSYESDRVVVASLSPTFRTTQPVGSVKQKNVLKRVFDFVISATSLLFLLPLFAAIALLIKMEDGGPVFFRQQRNGLNLKKFNIYKFRSMRAECSTEFVQVRAGDDRITRVGRLLRLTSLDELPQLINILLGDMSLVGPRPHAVDHDKLFAALVPGYMDRYRVLPGLTGLAQVRGLRGPTPNQQVMSERIFADLEYVQRNSLIVDLGIIMRTVVVVLRAVNAH